MSNIDIIRAWKDEAYLESLSEEERSHLPENPAGIIELSDEEMEKVGGGFGNTFACVNVDVNATNNLQVTNMNISVNGGNGGYCNNLVSVNGGSGNNCNIY